MSKLAFTRDSLVWFGHVLDSVLEFAVPLGQLPSYHVALTGRAPVREAWRERNSLTGSKVGLRRCIAFRVHMVELPFL